MEWWREQASVGGEASEVEQKGQANASVRKGVRSQDLKKEGKKLGPKSQKNRLVETCGCHMMYVEFHEIVHDNLYEELDFQISRPSHPLGW